MIKEGRYSSQMPMRAVIRTAALLLTMLVVACTAEVVPPEREYRSPEFCLDERRWDEVIAYTREFGAARGFRFAGGANAFEGAGLNIGLLKGGGLFRQEKIALYVMSNPFARRKSDFVAITRDKLTPADAALAKNFEAGLLMFSCS